MDVKTVEETTLSSKSLVTYLLIAGALIAAGVLPTFVVPGYGDLLNTVILVLLLGLVGRALVSALFAFSSSDPPAVPDDGDLPSVSVVIPAYNEAPVLQDTIDACKTLDYPDELLEFVLCYEAASTDRTAEIAERAASEDDRFVAVERDEPGGGKAKATNYALRYATGDVVASIDADHQFKPNAVRRAVAWFDADDDVWCVKGRCYGRNPDDSLIALHATVERHIAEKADLFAREVCSGFTIFGGGQAFFRREAFDELGDFDETVLVEDIDMSARIHAAGKELRVDPRVITYEENPATLAAWWSQRTRWARGWMQVAVRYLPVLPGNADLPVGKRADAAYTFAYALVPVLFALALPLAAVRTATGLSPTAMVPHAGALWTLISVAPAVVAYLVFAQDWLEGERHHPYEYAAAFTLWLYLIFQTVVFVVAFIDEFVLNSPSVYVTTSRVEKVDG